MKAGTIEVAEQNLSLAIESLEEKGLTEGQVSIFWANPNNDIGLWYNNLLKSRELLKNTTDEKLLDQSIILRNQKSELVGSDFWDNPIVSRPEGISIYPHNQLFFRWCILSIVGMIGSIIRLVILASNYDWDDPLIERKDNTVKA